MKKFGYFLLGTVLGAAAGVVAASMIPDEKIEKVKDKLKDNTNLEDLKEKYDNGTEALRNQLASFPGSVEDDSELKDFDDIVIDDSDNKTSSDDKTSEESAEDLNNAEKSDESETDPESPSENSTEPQE